MVGRSGHHVGCRLVRSDGGLWPIGAVDGVATSFLVAVGTLTAVTGARTAVVRVTAYVGLLLLVATLLVAASVV